MNDGTEIQASNILPPVLTRINSTTELVIVTMHLDQSMGINQVADDKTKKHV